MSKRIQTREEAAEELGLKLSTFDVWVRKGILPAPIPKTKRWDMKAIHAKLDKVSGLAQDTASPYQRWQREQDEIERKAHKQNHQEAG